MPPSPKFVADAMLGSLARKLRIFGFDTVYFREGPDSELLRIAEDERRVILSSDRGLLETARRKGLVAILIEGRSERERMASLDRGTKERSVVLAPDISRCALCNAPLVVLKREDVSGQIPSGVSGRHRVYYRCGACDKLYWKGGHWKRLKRLSSMLALPQP